MSFQLTACKSFLWNRCESVSSIPAGSEPSGRCMLCQKFLNEELVRSEPCFPHCQHRLCLPPCTDCTVLSCRKKQADSSQMPHSSFTRHRDTPSEIAFTRRLLKPSRKRPNSCFNNVSLYSCHTYYSRLSKSLCPP